MLNDTVIRSKGVIVLNIIEQSGHSPLRSLISQFLPNPEYNLIAENSDGWVIEISHCEDADTGMKRSGNWVNVIFAIEVKEELMMDAPTGVLHNEDDILLNGLILMSHVTDLENIMKSLQLDLDVNGWEIGTYDNEQ